MDIDYEIVKTGEVNRWPQSVEIKIHTSWGDASFGGTGGANEKALYLLEEAYREAKLALWVKIEQEEMRGDEEEGGKLPAASTLDDPECMKEIR